MCGRFVITTKAKDLELCFQAEALEVGKLSPSYNVAPTRTVPVIWNNDETKQRQISLMKWGLIPAWAKDEKIGSKMINARAETITEKPSFRQSFKQRRLIVPASGFYEWEISTRDPYFIRRKEGELLAFAGIWDEWKTPEGKTLQTFSIITTEPNELLASIHNRMPVILEPQDYSNWLGLGISTDEAKSFLVPLAAQKMEAWRVSKIVNNPRNNGAENLEKL
jgi:putative SOS response-associated peptidase YedK